MKEAQLILTTCRPQFRALIDDDALKAKVKALTEVQGVKKSPGLVDQLHDLIKNL
jgi:hypothetical protein